MIIIDATNTILGRMASYAAKKSLMGEQIVIINCEKSVVTGDKHTTVARYVHEFRMGQHVKGPFKDRAADKMVKRTIRGMVPHKQAKGREAMKRIMCYKGVPAEFQGKKAESVEGASVDKLPSIKYTTLEYISRMIGGK